MGLPAREKLTAAAACVFAAAVLLAQDYRVPVQVSRQGPVAKVLDKVDAANDVWIGEQDYELLRTFFSDLSKKIRAGERPLPALTPTLARFASVEVAEFKIVQSGRTRTDVRETVAGLRVELSGKDKAGNRISFWTTAAARFELSGSQARLLEFVPEPWRSSQAPKPGFNNVSEAALGANESWRRQLSRGVDWWRQRMDPSAGPDVYGHNGVSVADVDGDGFEDIFLPQPAGLPNRLYRNNGNGTFADITTRAALGTLDATTMGLFADIDNDGDPDLFLITSTRVHLYVNDGKGRFTRNAQSGFQTVPAGTLTGAAAADFNNDGLIDLYVCNYGFFSPGAAYDAPTPYYDASNGPPNLLYRNLGNGKFENASTALENNNRFSFAAAWADFDRDGDMDLYVANDFGRNNLYRNDGTAPDGKFLFRDVAAELGVDDLAAGMSAAWADVNNDGFPDLYVGNMWSSAGQRLTHNSAFRKVANDESVRGALQRQARGNSLFLNQAGKAFHDATLTAGVEFGRWAWASDFVDVNNDGEQDIYIQNGYVTGPDTHDL